MADATVPKISFQQASAGSQKTEQMTKCGGRIQTWKKRWFVLKGDQLYYFKENTDDDAKGSIPLETWSICKEASRKKRVNCFSITSRKRTYFIDAGTPESRKAWIAAVKQAIDTKKGVASPATTTSPTPTTTPASTTTNTGSSMPSNNTATTNTPKEPTQTPGGGSGAPTNHVGEKKGPRAQLANGKKAVPFLQDQESKVQEFWEIWFHSIPEKEELQGCAFGLDFTVSTSADMEKLTWRAAGPQNIFIQRMVDFFWNVGAPETEIEKLNDVGGQINPVKIGSWIDMSYLGGMDGGWYFPVDVTVGNALDAADAGEAVQKVGQWAQRHHIESFMSVGRDMGAAPPRQTEFKIKLPTNSFENQLKIALDAYEMFGFPAPPDAAMALLRSSGKEGLYLSVITSSEGFVRIGLLAPKPSADMVLKLCSIVESKNQNLTAFESHLGVSGPSFVEYQFLNTNFGYSVYKEGFDIMFHYHVGEETFTS